MARLTSGLEPALVDHQEMRLTALDPMDDRAVDLRVAGPAALLVAKLTKIHERQDEVAAGKANPRRIRGKDAVDVFRLLLKVAVEDLVRGFRVHDTDEHTRGVSASAVNYLRAQHAQGPAGHLAMMLAGELPDQPVMLAQLEFLVVDILAALEEENLFSDE